jgi:hypothetical protein
MRDDLCSALDDADMHIAQFGYLIEIIDGLEIEGGDLRSYGNRMAVLVIAANATIEGAQHRVRRALAASRAVEPRSPGDRLKGQKSAQPRAKTNGKVIGSAIASAAKGGR